MALAGDWSFLHERYRPEVDEDEEEEEVEAEHESPGVSGPRIVEATEIPEFIEDEDRKGEENWLCEMSKAGILRIPYIPECPRPRRHGR